MNKTEIIQEITRLSDDIKVCSSILSSPEASSTEKSSCRYRIIADRQEITNLQIELEDMKDGE